MAGEAGEFKKKLDEIIEELRVVSHNSRWSELDAVIDSLYELSVFNPDPENHDEGVERVMDEIVSDQDGYASTELGVIDSSTEGLVKKVDKFLNDHVGQSIEYYATPYQAEFEQIKRQYLGHGMDIIAIKVRFTALADRNCSAINIESLKGLLVFWMNDGLITECNAVSSGIMDRVGNIIDSIVLYGLIQFNYNQSQLAAYCSGDFFTNYDECINLGMTTHNFNHSFIRTLINNDECDEKQKLMIMGLLDVWELS